MNIAGHELDIDYSELTSFSLSITFIDSDTEEGRVMTMHRNINCHLGPEERHKRADSRRDITKDHIEDAASYAIAMHELDNSVEVTQLKSVKVVEETTIRRSEYKDW